jgi:hypothetical protein
MVEILLWLAFIFAFGAYFVGVYHLLQEKDRIGYRKLIKDHQKRLDSDIKL